MIKTSSVKINRAINSQRGKNFYTLMIKVIYLISCSPYANVKLDKLPPLMKPCSLNKSPKLLRPGLNGSGVYT